METLLSHRGVGDGLPILIIHGWEMDGEVDALAFEPVFQGMAGFRRLYVDLPGMGASPANGIRNLEDIYSRLVHFIDHYIGQSRFLLIGTSCGGYLARAIAGKYHSQVDGLLLRVPLVEPENSKRDINAFHPLVRNEEVLAGISQADRDQLGNILIQTPEYVATLDGIVKSTVTPAIARSDSEVLDLIRSDIGSYMLPSHLLASNAKLPAPTLILLGRHDDTVGYRDGLRLLELYPRATLAVLDRGTHAMPVDENLLFNALVKDWLCRVAEWQSQR